MAAYDRGDYATAIQALTHLSLPVTGTRGWNFAEVTAGSIPLQEVNPSSMASRRQPGLYLIGEILDCDGRIGGFNFQWAWSTGYIAGTRMQPRVCRETAHLSIMNS